MEGLINQSEEDRHSKDLLSRKQVLCFYREDGKKARFSYSNQKSLAQAVDDHLQAAHVEPDKFFDDICSIAVTFTTYKEGFVLCESTPFMQVLRDRFVLVPPVISTVWKLDRCRCTFNR